MGMSVKISTAALARILRHASSEPDREICGLLFGSAAAIDAAEPARNVADTPDRRFEIDPQALFAAIRAQRQGGPRLIGHYHSHPSGEVAPSACDAAAAEPGRLWLIAAGGQVAAWRAEAGGPLYDAFLPVRLAITA